MEMIMLLYRFGSNANNHHISANWRPRRQSYWLIVIGYRGKNLETDQ